MTRLTLLKRLFDLTFRHNFIPQRIVNFLRRKIEHYEIN